MPNPKILEKRGLTKENLEKFWTAKTDTDERKKLRELLTSRLNDGIDSGLRDHQIYWAIDLACDSPFNQITPTLVRDLISRCKIGAYDSEKIKDIAKQWNVNIDDLVRESIDEKGCKKTVLDAPILFQVIVPLVRSYMTIRRAKLFNDLNLFPFLKYEPIKFTLVDRIIGEILTDIVQQIVQTFGYPAILKQVILQALQYGTCLMFPCEEWYEDKQFEFVDEKEKELSTKAGVRYMMPHPTRFFWDKAHRISTFNTDTGCEFAGHWHVTRYGTILDNPNLWNKDAVAVGKVERFASTYRNYFQEIYPCAMSFPTTARTGAGEHDRETDIDRYATGDRDKAVFLSNVFMRLVPKDWGFGDYPYPIWNRFVMANDQTVMWHSPICYRPVLHCGYDTDEQRRMNPGMALEILPHQDHFSICLSQWILSARQNLSKAVFYDTDQVDQQYVEQLENMGARRYAGIPYIPYSSRKAKLLGRDPTQAFNRVDFPIVPTVEISQLMLSILNVLERIMGLSAQEIGQAASHEQSAVETRVIAGNTSNRVNFTRSFVEDFIDGWKNQLYEATRAYMDEDITAQVAINVPGSEDALKAIGFEVKDSTGSESGQNKAVVAGKISKLNLDAFISTREGENRIDGPAIAGAMSNLLQVALNNPVTAPAIGPDQALLLITEIGKLAGMPTEFRLKVAKGASNEEKMTAIQQALEKIQKETIATSVKAAEAAIGDPIAEELQKTNQAVAAVAQESQAVAQRQEQLEIAIANLIKTLQPILQLTQQAAQPAPEQNDQLTQEPALV